MLILLCIVLVSLSACGGGQAETGASAQRIEIDLDKSDPERLLRYYFGGYVGAEAQDPFEMGLLIEEEGRYYLDSEVFDERQPEMHAILMSAAPRGALNWEALEPFFRDTYYAARQVPATLDVLKSEVPYSGEGWMQVGLDGVMTTARRRVFVEEAALRQALAQYQENNEQVLYPVGTTMVGEHWQEDQHIETTVMRKRADGFWDFFTYGQDGTLAAETKPLPRSLKTPTQCVGCHFGAKQFEPERSFPGAAPDGPHGSRALHVDETLRDPEVVDFFDEHRKRSDTILGLYSTLFVAQLRADRRAGRLTEEDAALLDQLGL